MLITTGIVDAEEGLSTVEEARSRGLVIRGVVVTNADTGRAVLAFLAGDSRVEGRVVVEALLFVVSPCETRDVLDALEIESRIL